MPGGLGPVQDRACRDARVGYLMNPSPRHKLCDQSRGNHHNGSDQEVSAPASAMLVELFQPVARRQCIEPGGDRIGLFLGKAIMVIQASFCHGCKCWEEDEIEGGARRRQATLKVTGRQESSRPTRRPETGQRSALHFSMRTSAPWRGRRSATDEVDVS